MLAKSDATTISKALADANAGRATLVQLSQAHELAQRGGANKCVGLLRHHIRNHVPAPIARNEIKSIALGIVSGCVTAFLLGRMR